MERLRLIPKWRCSPRIDPLFRYSNGSQSISSYLCQVTRIIVTQFCAPGGSNLKRVGVSVLSPYHPTTVTRSNHLSCLALICTLNIEHCIIKLGIKIQYIFYILTKNIYFNVLKDYFYVDKKKDHFYDVDRFWSFV